MQPDTSGGGSHYISRALSDASPTVGSARRLPVPPGELPSPSRKDRHIIGNIGYAQYDGPSWLICDTDGTRLDAASPDALVDAWVDHGGKTDRNGAGRAQRRGLVPRRAHRKVVANA